MKKRKFWIGIICSALLVQLAAPAMAEESDADVEYTESEEEIEIAVLSVTNGFAQDSDGAWYICDVGFHTFMKTQAESSYERVADQKYTLAVSDGKAVWE